MKYYVYAGYYENFISGHKLPKPYTLRDEFKTFDEALDYVWENWEDDAIFFTEDVIGDAIDNGFINDENWEDYLMEESKKSARKSIKEAKVMSYDEFKKIVKKEFIKDEIEGFGKTNNGYGVYVIAYGEKEIEIMCDNLRQYGFECKWWHSSDPEDDEPIYFIEAIPIMNESKKSARKSIKESLNFKKDYEVEVSGGDYWFKPFYWDFDEFRDDLLIASEESGFTYHITTASTSKYRINIEFNNGPSIRYDITFRIIPKSNKETLKELNDYLN